MVLAVYYVGIDCVLRVLTINLANKVLYIHIISMKKKYGERMEQKQT